MRCECRRPLRISNHEGDPSLTHIRFLTALAPMISMERGCQLLRSECGGVDSINKPGLAVTDILPLKKQSQHKYIRDTVILGPRLGICGPPSAGLYSCNDEHRCAHDASIPIFHMEKVIVSRSGVSFLCLTCQCRADGASLSCQETGEAWLS